MLLKEETTMPRMYHENEGEAERRYDPETLREVTALAARLQSEYQEVHTANDPHAYESQETLTVGDIEAIGAEVGLAPEFIRQALAQHTANQTEAARQMEAEKQAKALTPATVVPVSQTLKTEEEDEKQGEYWATVTAFTLPIFLGTFAYAFKFHPGILTLFTLITPAPLSALMGFLTGNRRIGFAAAVSLVLALAPSFLYLYYPNNMDVDSMQMADKFGTMFTYALFGIPLAGWMGTLGASLRDHFSPATPPRPVVEPVVSALEPPRAIPHLEPGLKAQKQRRAFLSVDTANALEMRHGVSDLTAEHAFSQYRRWADEVARACGGQPQGKTGDALLFAFQDDASAIRAARRLQEGIPAFNTALNRLPLPFRIRCGISAGEVATQPGTPYGTMHSPVIEWAAILQQRAEPGDILVSGEVAATALVELGRLTPLPETIYGASAFSWRGGPSLQRSNGGSDSSGS
jgi:class 3 adenylate cyclase